MANKEITIKIKVPLELTDLIKKLINIDLDKTDNLEIPEWINEDLTTFAEALKNELNKHINITEDNESK